MCVIDGYGHGDVATLDRTEFPKARKRHTCQCCHMSINPGETYLRRACLFDGHWHHERVCSVCGAMSRWFYQVHNGGQYGPADFAQELWDCLDEHRPLLHKEDRTWRLFQRILQRRWALAEKEKGQKHAA